MVSACISLCVQPCPLSALWTRQHLRFSSSRRTLARPRPRPRPRPWGSLSTLPIRLPVQRHAVKVGPRRSDPPHFAVSCVHQPYQLTFMHSPSPPFPSTLHVPRPSSSIRAELTQLALDSLQSHRALPGLSSRKREGNIFDSDTESGTSCELAVASSIHHFYLLLGDHAARRFAHARPLQRTEILPQNQESGTQTGAPDLSRAGSCARLSSSSWAISNNSSTNTNDLFTGTERKSQNGRLSKCFPHLCCLLCRLLPTSRPPAVLWSCVQRLPSANRTFLMKCSEPLGFAIDQINIPAVLRLV